jgi:hypothetical protein
MGPIVVIERNSCFTRLVVTAITVMFQYPFIKLWGF